jgi:2,5-furandicarboxylate decarboxylase 1
MNLRNFLSKLEKENKLIRIKKEVSTNYEIANVMYSIDEKPVIFENVKGFDFQIFGGITSNRDIIANGLGTTKDKILYKLVEALRDPKEPEMTDKAPCQEVVIKDPDLSKIPLLYHLDGDGGRYASATVSTIKDPDTGRNVSYHRLMEIGKNKFTARLIKNRQTRTTYDKLQGDLEMAVCIGNSVAVMIAASLGPPSGVDEFSIANALDKTPMIKCITKDLEVPAESEIVLEGRLTRELDREGPFVDLTETRDF